MPRETDDRNARAVARARMAWRVEAAAATLRAAATDAEPARVADWRRDRLLLVAEARYLLQLARERAL